MSRAKDSSIYRKYFSWYCFARTFLVKMEAMMEFYAASGGCSIKPEDLEIFRKIQVILDAMPDIVFDPEDRNYDPCKNQMSCHLICRALAKYLPVVVEDGFFYNSYEHSWLVSTSECIIDVYPVAGAAPFIVARDPYSPWSRLYEESKLRPEFATDEFKNRLEKTVQMVGETMMQLGFA